MSTETAIASFYSFAGIRSRLEDGLAKAGLLGDVIDWSQLALGDQFHAGGLEATRAIGSALAPQPHDRLLDVGSGFGGPARFFAGTYGCQVTGIDLTPEYVEIANYLSARTGQDSKTRFLVGNALELPFEDANFELAITQHVGMNVQDKPRFYSEIFRVLKPGGKLAIFDIVRLGEDPITFPQPWASDSAASFVVHPEEILDALRNAKFQHLRSENLTPLALQGFADLARLMASAGETLPFNLVSLLGGGAKDAVKNLAQGLGAGQLQAQLFVAQKGAEHAS